MPKQNPYCVAVKPIEFLVQSEAVDHTNVDKLVCEIRTSGKWTTPIPVSRETGIVMDGNHRLTAAAILGLRHLPCVLLDYLDPRVSVTEWKTGIPFQVDAILQRLLCEKALFPYKTTRHAFAPSLPVTDIPLDILQ
ncbi:ParB N-terminal domain-containing protein [Paraburkholderia sp. Ac-20340]|uniref:ParB N-terminal domain-containing protein n=1 Tax=Paraburkholderia sp. Ac-20340 TaxID=2703888 RepID=UPI001980EC1F|nr:ParB N-terminal domain-containing protein [Paraburkholderia sp. Ac-20340]MBN3857503.1 ParB N-terminal domain-containing protein [Paraburkholderia sp. Ac-20340]